MLDDDWVHSTYFGLEQSAFEQNKRLPLELVDELAKGYAKIMVDLALLVLQQLRQALLEPLQDLDIGKVPLCEPCCSHNP